MLENLPDSVGHALRHVRAGFEHLTFNQVEMRAGMGAIALNSLAFADHAPIPPIFTADGEGTSPPLHWTGVLEGASSLALIVEDADAPTPQPLVHAIAVHIPPGDGALSEGALQPHAPRDSIHLTHSEMVQTGRNSYWQSGWLPPDPPPGHGVHRYVFQIFALGDPSLVFSVTPGRSELLRAIREHGLASGMLVGTYERPDGSVKLGQTVATVGNPSGPTAV